MRHTLLALAAGLSLVAAAAAQDPGRSTQDAVTRRVDERIRTLQREAERLAGEARTLLTELRTLEVERDLRVAEAGRASAAVLDVQRAIEESTSRLADLEAQRLAQLPDLKTQLVDVYKRGRGGYARLLFGADDLRDFARASRTVAALASINQRRIDEHRSTLDALRRETTALQQKSSELESRQADARQAQAAAERAVRARAALVEQLDSRRDLNAQYVGELQVAYERLQQQIAGAAAGRESGESDAVAVPLAPFRGALEWPAAGRITGRYGQTAGRLGGSAVRNGIEIAAAEDAPVRAVHGGTVAYADSYTGFGNLVIVDHGDEDYSLYGYLASTAVQRDDTVEAGTELGRVGSAPAGPPALYFEMRIDGRSVDPVQWLRSR